MMSAQEQPPLTQLSYHQKRLVGKSLQLKWTKGKESTHHFSHNLSAIQFGRQEGNKELDTDNETPLPGS